MKLLVTGGSGFIGQHAIKAAIDRGWDVTSLDIRHPSESRRMDVRMLNRIDADVVLHLAAFSSNAGFADRLADNWACNVMGTWNVLRLAAQSGARVVYASSSAVYANSAERCGELEDHNHEGEFIGSIELESHYGRSKLMNEMTAASFADLGLKCLGLRIFNAYGPGDELKPVGRQAPPTWMAAAKKRGEPIVIYGDGSQAKDFIHVSDVVEIIMRLIEREATGIVNVGTGVATSFNDLAELVDKCVDKHVVCRRRGLRPIPDPASYQYFTRADCTRLFGLIGKYDFIKIEDGICEVLA